MIGPDEDGSRHRYRVAFRKGGSLRFLSHHDMMRLFGRALRRSGLPLRMTRGFNPHPRFAILWPTSVGMTSQQDYLECELTQALDPCIVLQRLSAVSPSGLPLDTAEAVASSRATPVTSVEYEAVPPENVSIDPRQIAHARARQHWPVLRQVKNQQTKTIDIRPYVLALAEADGKVHMHLKVTPSGSARTTEVIEGLGYEHQDVLKWKINRARVHLATASWTMPR